MDIDESSAIFLETNVIGTGVLLDAALECKLKRFHQISTDEVYGDIPIDEDRLFCEGDNLAPSSPYSASKAAADMLALSYFKTHGLQVSITRSSNNYGAYQHPEKLIPKIITLAERGENIPIYGTGENMRDWISVSDNCRAIDLAMRRGEPGEIYNAGGGNIISNINLARRILKIMDKPEGLIYFAEDRPGHDRKYAVDTEKLASLGYAPEIPFEKGLRATVEWYRKREQE